MAIEGSPAHATGCPLIRSATMAKHQRSNKEAKKEAILTPKEKKAAKKAKGEVKAGLGIDRTR